MRTLGILIGVGVLAGFTGCSSPAQFPINGSHALTSTSEFGVLTAQPDVYKGRAMKLAGRMVSVESTAHGTVVLADWLPYPQVESDGPEDEAAPRHSQFTVMYPGKLDADGSLYGNKFLAVGKMDGTQSGEEGNDAAKNLPTVIAHCLHVWKTGDAEIELLDNEYFVMEETYCAES